MVQTGKCWTWCFEGMEVSKVAKIRNRYNQVPHLTQDTNGKVTNLQKTPQTRAKRSALSQQINIFKIIDTRISFYSRNTHLLPPKPKSSFHHLKRGIQDFHMNYVLVPADKAANNVVVVWRLYYINTLKRELVDTNAYKPQPSLSERVIVDGHGCHKALHFGVKAKENQDKVPTLYWLPKLHKKPYKARLIANSSSCTTTELSKLLTSCLTAVKNMLSNIVKRYMRDPVKTYFGRLKIQVKF